MQTLGFAQHDHSTCIRSSIDSVAEQCRAAGLQLTPMRRRVLEILLQDHRALGAYDILDTLRSEGHSAQPPVAYRALDFLVSNGFAHRIERLNAFVACCRPGEDHAPNFMICRVCHSVAEAAAGTVTAALSKAAHVAGFKIERTVVEAIGVCPNCRGKDAE